MDTETLKRTKQIKLKRKRWGEHPSCFHENERQEIVSSEIYSSIYDEAKAIEVSGIWESKPNDLDAIKREILIRLKITKNEIFKIGECLIMAKSISQKKGIGFQNWIRDNFDFSYETAKNFMNVYKNCMGYHEIAVRLPSSILYKLSKPGLSEELRNFLFTHCNLEQITNKDFQKLLKKFNEGGFEAIEDDMTVIQHDREIYRETNYLFDICENGIRTLNQLGGKIKPWIDLSGGKHVELNKLQIIYDLKEKIHLAIYDATNMLDNTVYEARNLIKEHLEILIEKKR